MANEDKDTKVMEQETEQPAETPETPEDLTGNEENISSQKVGQLRSQYKDLQALKPPADFLKSWVDSKAKELEISPTWLQAQMLLEKPQSQAGVRDKRKDKGASIASLFDEFLTAAREVDELEETWQEFVGMVEEWLPLWKKDDELQTEGFRAIVDVRPKGNVDISVVKIPQERD
jgi:hypothetical protein